MTDPELSRLYPELAGQRRLADALRNQLLMLGSRVQVDDPLGSAYAYARRDQRSCQVNIALRERAFSVDFWDRGVQYGYLWSPDLDQIALAIQSFAGLGAATADLRQLLPKVEIRAAGRAHEFGTLVEFQWHQYLSTRPLDWPDDLLHDVFALAAKGRLRALMPFTSLSRACFSTRTGYPYTWDCPAIEVLRDGACRVFPPGQMDGGTPVFTGALAEAVRRAEALLSPTITAARDGTAEDDDVAQL